MDQIPAGLLDYLVQHYNEGELRTLCFNLSIDYDSLPAIGKADKARELITYCARFGRTNELITAAQHGRPSYTPPSAPDAKTTHDGIDQMLRRLEGLQTGGDSYCYWMLYHFDLQKNIANNFVIIRKGEFPLYDVRIRIRNMRTGQETERQWGEINAPADYIAVKWQLPTYIYYRVFFHARNGSWHQDLQLHRSEKAQCWLAATRVIGNTGEIKQEHIDNDYIEEFGSPAWEQ